MTIAPATVLVVEDNDEMRAFLCRQLADHYRVIEAANGDEGWEQVQEEQPDLLLSDAEMPGTDGWTLGRRVKEAADLPSIPVILLEGESIDPRTDGASAADTGSAGDEEAESEQSPEAIADDPAADEGDSGAPDVDNGAALDSEADETGPEASDDVEAEEPSSSPKKPDVEAVLEKPFVLQELQDHLERYLPTRELPNYVDAAGDFLKEVVQTVERRLHDPDFTAGALAKAMSLSRRHLTRRLKATAGTTPAALIRERRIERAKAHFEEGDTKVVDVCTTVGFRSASHFSQSFREYEGCSPTEYIEQVVS